MISSQVKGRRLTALVFDNAHSHQEVVSIGAYDDDDNDVGSSKKPKSIPFGDNGQARLFSVKCHKHKA